MEQVKRVGQLAHLYVTIKATQQQQEDSVINTYISPKKYGEWIFRMPPHINDIGTNFTGELAMVEKHTGIPDLSGINYFCKRKACIRV